MKSSLDLSSLPEPDGTHMHSHNSTLMHMFAGLEACTNKYNAARLGVSCELQSGTLTSTIIPGTPILTRIPTVLLLLNEDTKL